jgi:hypothetical protein
MDQRSICLFPAMKRLSAQAIYNELIAMLSPDAIGYSTVTNYLRQRHFPSTFHFSQTTENASKRWPIYLEHQLFWDRNTQAENNTNSSLIETRLAAALARTDHVHPIPIDLLKIIDREGSRFRSR